jgi:hypothetical protein
MATQTTEHLSIKFLRLTEQPARAGRHHTTNMSITSQQVSIVENVPLDLGHVSSTKIEALRA